MGRSHFGPAEIVSTDTEPYENKVLLKLNLILLENKTRHNLTFFQCFCGLSMDFSESQT